MVKIQKLKFVKTEFIKWNGRLNTLKEGAQRESAQNKLNCLAEMKLEYEKTDPYDLAESVRYIDDIKKNNHADIDSSFLEEYESFNHVQV